MVLVFGAFFIHCEPAHAQFVCGGSPDGGEPQNGGGAAATDSGSMACGSLSVATGGGTSIGAQAGAGSDPTNVLNVAIGNLAGITVTGSDNSAFGSSAGQTVTGVRNTATGNFAGGDVSGSNNTATGYNSGNNVTGSQNTASGLASGNDVTGSDNTASGAGSGQNVTGNSNAAFGDSTGQHVTGDNNIAVGTGAGSNITASDTVAIGSGANASANGAVAIGSGATATRANQQAFGTSNSTYTLAGLASAASKAAQSGTTYLVTSDAQGNLATTAFSPQQIEQSIDALERRDDDLAGGIAIALSLAQPMIRPGQTFAMRLGWGNFDGENAVGLTAAGVVSQGDFGPTSSVIVDGGIGTARDQVAGRGGVSFGW